MTDYIPETYLTEIGLRHEVLQKLNGDFVFTLAGLKTAIASGQVFALLTAEELEHVKEKIAAWDAAK